MSEFGQLEDEKPPPPPGTEKVRRFRPKLRYELIGCGLHGHLLVGTDVAEIRPEDHIAVREADGLRWYRCFRCDSWLPLPPPTKTRLQHLPPRDEITLPLRGRPLRDRFVLRLIAIDRVLHFLVLGALAVAIFIFAQDRARLKGEYTKVLNAVQGAVGGPLFDTKHNTIFHDINHLFTLPTSHLYVYGAVIALYAAVNGVEAVGLWSARRWAEYLTLVEVVALIPLEIYELSIRVTTLKTLTLILNVAIVVYLVWVHRLVGVRGGGKAEKAMHERDVGWPAVERSTPHGRPVSVVPGAAATETIPAATS